MAQIWNIENALVKLTKLNANQKPVWGEMSAQRMVEHLTDAMRAATGKMPQTLGIPEDKALKMQAFLESEKPMARDIKVPFATPEMKLRNEDIDLAVDEFIEEWIDFEDIFSADENHRATHYFYGALNHDQWNKLNDKHLTHHFEQFGLI